MHTHAKLYELEILEPRQLFSFASLADGILFVDGVSSNDDIQVFFLPGDVDSDFKRARVVVAVINADGAPPRAFTEDFAGEFKGIRISNGGAPIPVAVSPSVAAAVNVSQTDQPRPSGSQPFSSGSTLISDPQTGEATTAAAYAARLAPVAKTG